MYQPSLSTLWIVAATSFTCAAAVSAQAPSQVSNQSPMIEILECVVYPEGHISQTVDCSGPARARCGGSAVCELPIGLGLTDGRQIDNDAHTWKKVRVRYRCGKVEKINGPHNQSENAAMLLGCRGGF